MATATKQSPREFFTEHGWTVTNADGSPVDVAGMLATAEYRALTEGVTFEWVDDDTRFSDTLGDHEYWCERAEQGKRHSHRVEGCIARDARGEIVASLWGIIDPDRNYRRVIQAELASEVFAA